MTKTGLILSVKIVSYDAICQIVKISLSWDRRHDFLNNFGEKLGKNIELILLKTKQNYAKI
jgi:hypothetical protein